MHHLRHPVAMILLIVLAMGCNSADERLVRQVTESNRQQSEQNQEMAKLHHEVAEGTSRLVNAVAESREELLDMEHDLQNQRAQLDAERRSLADERRRESLLAPILSNVGLMLVAALPLILCWYLLHGLHTTDEDVSEILIENLVAKQPAITDAPSNRQAIQLDPPPAPTEDPSWRHITH